MLGAHVSQPYIVASDQAHPRRFQEVWRENVVARQVEGKMAFQAS